MVHNESGQENEESYCTQSENCIETVERPMYGLEEKSDEKCK